VSPKRCFRVRAGSTVAWARLRQEGSTQLLAFSLGAPPGLVRLPSDDAAAGRYHLNRDPVRSCPIQPGDVTVVEVEGVGTHADPVTEG
jgi:hypothetical protein